MATLLVQFVIDGINVLHLINIVDRPEAIQGGIIMTVHLKR